MSGRAVVVGPIPDEAALVDRMTTPDDDVRAAVARLDGDIVILGIAGKMGPTLGELLVRAGAKRVIGVSRFSDPASRKDLEDRGIQTVRCDLVDPDGLAKLPDAPFVYLMAGHKFGSTGNEPVTWAMNTLLPARVMARYPSSKVVYVSSGNVYRFTPVTGRGAAETDAVDPIGEYAQSRLGGERLVDYLSQRNGTEAAIVRLFYATELRYGIVLDIAQRIAEGRAIDLSMGHVNQIWQGDANAYLARMFPLCRNPARVVNMTGRDVLSVRALAEALAERIGKAPVLEGREQPTALLGDASALIAELGPPKVPVEEIVDWVAAWVTRGGRTLGKPTKYESRTGKF
jgi:nucleoside-diphosphate-sugar epimerase